jgi:TP901 family phage tail tape measure protein
VAKTAQVIYVGDAASLIRASQEASKATLDAADSIVKSNERVSSASMAAAKVAQESAAKFGASMETQAKVAGEAAAKQAKAAGASAEAQAAAYRKGADAAEAAAIRHGAAGSKIASAGKGAAIGLAAIGVASVDLATKLEGSTVAIAKAGGESQAQAGKISSAFLNTAGDAEYSAEKIGTAFAGVAGELKTVAGHALDAGEASKVMDAAMNLAEATGGELNSTTAALGKTMLVYRIGAEGAAGASDILFNASRNTGTSVEELANTVDKMHGRLGAVAPSLKDSATFIQLLAEKGVQGRQVMGALTGSFGTLLGHSKETTAVEKELGLQVYDSSGKFVGLKNVVDQLTPKLAHMTQERQLEYTKALFGATANKQLLDIILQGPAAYDRASAAVSKHGTAAKAAAEQSKSFEGTLKIVEATGENLGAMLGQVLVPGLKDVGKEAVDVTKFFKENEGAADALAVVVAVTLGGAIGAFTAEKVAGLLNGLKLVSGGLLSLATQSEATATVVEGSNTAMVASSQEAETGIDAAMAGTGIGAVLVGVALAAVEMDKHWHDAMTGLEEGAQGAGNFVIDRFNEMIEGVNEFTNKISFGLIPAIEKLHHLSGAGQGSGEITTTIPGGVSFGSKSELAKQGSIMGFFEAKGFSPAAAAGIVGNLRQESSLNPEMNTKEGIGLASWIGSRRTALEQFAKAKHAPVLDAGVQLEFMFKEMQSRGDISPLINAKDPGEAARIFEKLFEGASKPMMNKREEYAHIALGTHPQSQGHVEQLRSQLYHDEHNGAPSSMVHSVAHLLEAEKKAQAKAKTKGLSAASIEKWAESMVGHFPESSGPNSGPELDKLQAEFHTRAAAWCAEFATTAAMMGGANKAVRTASVATIREWAEKGTHGYSKGVSNTPHVGSLMMFGDSHVGFVSGVDKSAGTVTTIEGNTDVGNGAVRRMTHKISEGDYASPTYAKVNEGAVGLTQMSKAYELAAKQWQAKVATDNKAGQAQLSKILAAVHSGSLAELTKVVGGKHDHYLGQMVTRLHLDHSTALNSLAAKLVDAHGKAEQALVAAARVQFAKMAETVAALAKQAATQWGEKRRTEIEHGPESAAIKADREAGETEADARTERENKKALEDAQKKLKEAKGNENPQEIREAQEAVKRAEESMTEFARHQDEKRREKGIETGLEKVASEQDAYEAMLNSQLVALQHQLEKAEVSYAAYAAKVNAVLSANGIAGVAYTPEGSPIPIGSNGGVKVVGGTGPGGVLEYTEHIGSGESVRVGPGHASGGMVYPGVAYPVGETGREMFTPSTPGSITPASRAGSAPFVNVEEMHVHDERDVERYAHSTAHKLAFGGR